MRLRRLGATSVAAVIALTLGSVALTGCGNSDDSASSDQFTIGAAIIVSHPALEAVVAGFEEVLKEEGVKYKLISKNAQGDQANAATIASTFASNKDIDLILAVSTPIATTMAAAEKDRPILFAAVTDPVGDKLVPSWDKAGPNITGASDLPPEAKPVSLVQEAMPDVANVGVLYSSSESNSLAQVEAFEAEAKELGIKITKQGITGPNEVSAGLDALAGVDAILIPTDNTVVAAIASVIQFGQENKIPVFCADNSTVELGTVATRGLSYHNQGRRVGEMAVAILRDGKTVADFKPEKPTETELLVNPDAAKKFGLTLPEALVAQGTVVETK
ncbi:MAG: ABC transporter substrate-binding protein [Micrococcales bacterium]|nr:ABC transporter substrate-binding protein [Micrococcales bacterium]